MNLRFQNDSASSQTNVFSFTASDGTAEINSFCKLVNEMRNAEKLSLFTEDEFGDVNDEAKVTPAQSASVMSYARLLKLNFNRKLKLAMHLGFDAKVCG